MNKWKKRMRKSMHILLAILMIAINFTPLTISNVNAADVNYGIVYFRTKGCGTNTYYTNAVTGKSGYLNGCYSADGAFLGYNSNRTQVKFKVAGVTGWVDTSDVQVLDYVDSNNWDDLYTSNYYVSNGVLKHNVMSDIYSYGAGSGIYLGPKPSFLSNNTYYWSYDGHYFYPSTKQGYIDMITDYRNGNYSHAINNGNPYYNYYQYLSHRSISNYTPADVNNYFKNSGITAPMNSYPASSGESLLYGEQTSFVQYQNEFGANLGLTIGVATNESASGTSNIAFYGKNLFGHSAFDSSPGASATSYLSVAQSIYAHDKFYISEGFLDPCDGVNAGGSYNESLCHRGRYYGGHVGDKASGMNVKYASDAYWGEKAAQFYYLMDNALTMQDYNKYTIAVKEDANSRGVYREATTASTLLYKTGNTESYPVIVLGEVTGETVNGNNKWYKIQTDPVLNHDRTAIVQDSGYYNYRNNYAYVPAAYFKKVNTGKTVKNRYNITFDANGGMYSDGTTGKKTITAEQNAVPEINAPTKEGDTFIGWTPVVMGASEDITYVAQWKNQKYNITFNPNGGSFSDGTTTNKVVEYGTGIMPSTNPLKRDGYTFKGWTPELKVVTQDTTYTAMWEKNITYYNIIFDANGGKFSDGTTTITKKTEEGKTPEIEQPSRDGYEFKGWSKEISPATGNTTYLANWEKVETFAITFDANGGTFSNNKTTKTVTTIKGKIPNAEIPSKDGYVFTGWDKELVAASSNTTYKATWEEGSIEDKLTKKDGDFYLNELKWNASKKQYDVSGYLIMLGTSNSKNDDIHYDMILKDKMSGKEYAVSVERWLNNVPFDLGSENGNDYSAAWFKGSVDFDDIPQGDYDVYMRAYGDKTYAKTIFSNLFNKSIIRRGETENKGTSFIVELGKVNKQLVLSVRDEGLITTGESNTFRNMTNDYDDISFQGNLLRVMGTSYNYGGNYADSSKIKRTLILEDINTYERHTYDLGSTNNGSYKVSIGDNVSKEYAWYNKQIDVTKLPKGTYSFIVYTKTSNVEDYGEITDKFAAINKAKQTINGTTYEVTLNKNRNNRLELKVY